MEVDVHTYKCIVNINSYYRKDGIPFNHSWYNPIIKIIINAIDVIILSWQAVELCLRSGAKISTQQHDLSTPVHLACAQGAIDIVKLMFGLQPNEKALSLSSCDVQKMTPLHCAAMFDRMEIVQYLVQEVRQYLNIIYTVIRI